ncbi:MAG: MBL fold metallo-hydrolase [Clostridia bacterium]|nr:MBL fold metallo-hydrolase [Clostridia bacterium]
MKNPKNYKRSFSIFPIIIISLIMLASRAFPKVSADTLQLCFVDVGQGDSVFLKTPDGETWLIDGGEYDAFDSELQPFLYSQGIHKVDYALVTHYHSDHMGGISELLESGGAENLVLPDYSPGSKAKTKLLKLAQKTGTSVLEMSEGDTLPTLDDNLKISVLHPNQGGFSSENDNNNSMVLKVEYFDTTILLTGDLEVEAEEILVKKYDLEADILKLGHHGSSTSTSDGFIEEVNPTYGIISAGQGNRYGHPHYEVLNRLDDNDVMIFRTDKDGDVTFHLSEKGIESIKTETNYSKE